MENESEIIAALQAGVTAAVAQSAAPGIPVKYLLIGPDPATQWNGVPQDQKWIELVWIPNNRAGDFLGQEQNHRGILRLILHWPNDNGGIYVPVEALASVTRYWKNGMVLSGVQVVGKPQPTGMIESEDDVIFPVSVYYQSYRR